MRSFFFDFSQEMEVVVINVTKIITSIAEVENTYERNITMRLNVVKDISCNLSPMMVR